MKKRFIAIISTLLLSLNLSADITNMEMIDTNGTSYKVKAEGSEFKITGMEGKVVFLEFFGLQCPACKKAIPHLVNLQNRYKDRLQIMAIEIQKNDVDQIKAYRAEHDINYITLSNYDVGSVARYIIEKSGWEGAIPFMVAIDSKGQVQFAQAGIMPEELLEKYIEEFSKIN